MGVLASNVHSGNTVSNFAKTTRTTQVTNATTGLTYFKSVMNLSKQILEQYFIQSEQNGGKIVTI